jgi:hypothetical protein
VSGFSASAEADVAGKNAAIATTNAAAIIDPRRITDLSVYVFIYLLVCFIFSTL